MSVKLTTFERDGKVHPVAYIETQQVQEGVSCDIYVFTNDSSCDLGIVSVKKGYKTPKQKILFGEMTIEGYLSGTGTLTVTSPTGAQKTYSFQGITTEVIVGIGDTMQWLADSDLVFYEICYPPYQEGRFQNIE